MVRWRDRFWFLAGVSLAVHFCAVTAIRLFAPPPLYGVADRAPAPTVDELRPIQPLPKPPDPIDPPADDALGEVDGTGETIATVDLPDRQQGPVVHDFEQAWTRQEPIVTAQPQPDDAAQKNAALVPSGMATDLPAMSRQAIGKGESGEEAPPTERPQETTANDGNAEQGEQAGPEQVTREATATPEQPVDPAEKGESDLDAFSEIESASFTRGGMQARQGRPVKISKPRIDLSARAEVTRLAGTQLRVTFFIETDSEGHPRRITLLKSSGSEAIDEATKLALYASWFGGKSPDRFPFMIVYY